MAQDDELTLKLGLLMEAAQQQQRLAASSLERFAAELQQLDASIREEVRRVLQTELAALASESRRTREALAATRRSVRGRTILWSVLAAAVYLGITVTTARWLLPSRAEVATLGAQRDVLARAVSELERRGAGLDLRPCGSVGQLCVRVDRKAPAYGVNGDYLVVKGH